MMSVLFRIVVVSVTALLLPCPSAAADVTSLQIRGKTIKVGDTADHVFSILKKDEMLKQDVGPDSKNPNSLALTKYYRADGKSFILAFARVRDPGPYVVTKIVFDPPRASSPARALRVVDFERSPFFQKYRLVRKDEWTLKPRGKNYHYSFTDPENPYSGIGVELSSDQADVKKISVSWHGQSTIEPARFTKTKEGFMRDLLRSTFLDTKPEALISYVRAQHGKRFPGGGNAIPRKTIDGVSVYSGTVGETLIVGVER